MNDPALVAALQALAGAVSGLPQAIIAANRAGPPEGQVPAFDRPQPVVVMGPKPLPVTGGTGGAKPKEKEEKPEPGLFGRAFGPLLAKFAAAVGPLALLGEVVGATTSGFQTMSKAVQVFATSVAPVLLPVTMLLATAFTAAADVIASVLLPGLEGFLGVILALGIPVLVTFIGAIEVVAKKLAEWAEEFVSKDAEVGDYFDSRRLHPDYDRILDEELANLKASGFEADTGWWKPQSYERFEEADRRAIARIAAGEGEDPSGTRATVLNALRDVVGSFSASVGPKAQISGLEGVGKSVQLAALNQDPLEARMLRVQTQIRDALEAAVSVLTTGKPPYRGSGDLFDGDF